MTHAARAGADGWRSVTERGSARLLGLTAWLAIRFGRAPLRLLMYPIAFYFYCTAPVQRRAARDFLRRATRREPRPREVWRQFVCFALTALDRFYFLSGHTAGFELVRDDADRIMTQPPGRGGVLLMSHLGVFDLLRATARDDRVKVSIVMDRRHGQVFTNLLERLDPALATRVIDARCPGPLLALRVKQAVDEGALVGIMADRVAGAQRSAICEVLGAQVALPVGAYLLAGALAVPLIVAFGLYEGGARYRARFELLDERGAPEERRARAAFLAQRYADRLTEFATRYPHNWFNFYDFFGDAAAGD